MHQSFSIIGTATLLKLGLWLYCRRLKDRSPAMLALAEDHWNDVLSNLAGIIGPTIAFYVPKVDREGRGAARPLRSSPRHHYRTDHRLLRAQGR